MAANQAKKTIDEVCNGIKDFFDKAIKPAQKLPDFLTVCDTFLRNGSSAENMFAGLFNDMKTFGAITNSTTADGKPSIVKAFTYSLIKNINDDRRMNEVIQSVIPPGTLNLAVIGNKATNLTPTRALGFPHCY